MSFLISSERPVLDFCKDWQICITHIKLYLSLTLVCKSPVICLCAVYFLYNYNIVKCTIILTYWCKRQTVSCWHRCCFTQTITLISQATVVQQSKALAVYCPVVIDFLLSPTIRSNSFHFKPFWFSTLLSILPFFVFQFSKLLTPITTFCW